MYQLDMKTSDGPFVTILEAELEVCQKMTKQYLAGYRIVSSDRKRLKNGSLSLRGVTGTRHYKESYNELSQANAYIDWLRENNKTHAYVFPYGRAHCYVVAKMLKAAGFELIEVPVTDYI